MRVRRVEILSAQTAEYDLFIDIVYQDRDLVDAEFEEIVGSMLSSRPVATVGNREPGHNGSSQDATRALAEHDRQNVPTAEWDLGRSPPRCL